MKKLRLAVIFTIILSLVLPVLPSFADDMENSELTGNYDEGTVTDPDEDEITSDELPFGNYDMLTEEDINDASDESESGTADGQVKDFLSSGISDDEIKSDAEKITDTEEYKKLLAFGIFNEDENISWDYVSRKNFVKYAVRICGLPYESFTSAQDIFSDVDENAEKEIFAAYKEGIISKSGDGLFNPERPVSISEAAKILTYILKYGEIAQNSGGYPMGYLTVANRLNLFSGCSLNSGDKISTLDFFTMLLNTLRCSPLNIDLFVTGSNSQYIKYSEDEKDLLSTVFDIYKVTGIFDVNEVTSIYGNGVSKRGRISIDGVSYNIGNTDAGNLLGYEVLGYYVYDEEREEKTLIYISAEKDKNTVTVVDGEDVAKSSVSQREFVYCIDEKTKKVPVSDTASFIYNGEYEPFDADLCFPESGEVTLIDNDTDGKIDVILVESYEILWVANMSLQNYTIENRFDGETIELDPNDKEYYSVITKDGKSVEFKDILTDDIVSYAVSLSGKVKKAVVSDKKITGSVDFTDDYEISVDGVMYRASKDVLNSATIRDAGTFYLDFMGRIVAKDTDTDDVYAYLNKIGRDKWGKVLVQLFTEFDRWVILELDSDIKFNYDKKMKSSDFYKTYGTSPQNYRQLITYKLNKAGKVSAINFAQEFERWSDDEQKAIDNNVFRLYKNTKSATYRGVGSFGNDILVRYTTKIFSVPDQSVQDADLDEFHIFHNTSSLVYNTVYKNIYAYDANRTGVCDVCVMIGNDTKIDSTSQMMIVTDLYKSLDKDETEVYAVKGMYNNFEDYSLLIKDSSVFDSVKENKDGQLLGKGDVIQFSIDPNGYVDIIQLIYTGKNGDDQKFLRNSLYSNTAKVVGTVKWKDNDVIVMDYGNGKEAYLSIKSPVVYIYNVRYNKVTVGTTADIVKGSYLIAAEKYYSCTEVIIIKNEE